MINKKILIALVFIGLLSGIVIGAAVTPVNITRTINYSFTKSPAQYTVTLISPTNIQDVNGTSTTINVAEDSTYTELYNITNNGQSEITVTASIGDSGVFIINQPAGITFTPQTVTIAPHGWDTIQVTMTDFTGSGSITINFNGV